MTSKEDKCIVWGTPATATPRGDSTLFESLRAGGLCLISGTAAVRASRLNDIEKISLTHQIINSSIAGDILLINSTNLETLVSYPPSQVIARSLRLLQRITEMTGFIGQRVNINFSLPGIADMLPPIGRSAKTYSAWTLLAWSDSYLIEELLYLFNLLASEDYIDYSTGQTSSVLILPKGYSKIHEENLLVKSDQAFVAMWFDKSMNQSFEKGIEPAIRDCGYMPVRIDQIEHVDKIDDRIISEIRRSRFLVADFTSEIDKPRGGVYFEAGFALGLGIPVIWTCRSDIITNIHFDTRQFNHIVWSNSGELREKLSTRIRAVI